MARAQLARPTDAPPVAHAVLPDGDVATLPGAGDDLGPAVRPTHVAIIMDGNRRWARERGLDELDGHAAGVEKIRWLVEHALRRGVAYLSVYAFSRENWARPDDEVVGLFRLLEQAIRAETPELVRQGVRVRLLGRIDELPVDLRDSIREALAATDGGTRLTLAVAFNYAGRTELVDAVRSVVADGLAPPRSTRRRSPRASTPAACPIPDLVIRTGGEQRLSQLPDLAERLRRVLVLRHAVAQLRRGGLSTPPSTPSPADRGASAPREPAVRERTLSALVIVPVVVLAIAAGGIGIGILVLRPRGARRARGERLLPAAGRPVIRNGVVGGALVLVAVAAIPAILGSQLLGEQPAALDLARRVSAVDGVALVGVVAVGPGDDRLRPARPGRRVRRLVGNGVRRRLRRPHRCGRDPDHAVDRSGVVRAGLLARAALGPRPAGRRLELRHRRLPRRSCHRAAPVPALDLAQEDARGRARRARRGHARAWRSSSRSAAARRWRRSSSGPLLGIVAQSGDLAESLLKRAAGAKDSGHADPGARRDPRPGRLHPLRRARPGGLGRPRPWLSAGRPRRPPVRVALLGSGGSIGTQAVDVLAGLAPDWQVVALATGSQASLLEAQARRLRPRGGRRRHGRPAGPAGRVRAGPRARMPSSGSRRATTSTSSSWGRAAS